MTDTAHGLFSVIIFKVSDTSACLQSASAAQVEIKLRLADREAHARVAEALKGSFRETHYQACQPHILGLADTF